MNTIPEQAGLLGLAFEPVPGRATPDVEGVLWLDAATAALRHLEFTYTNPGLERPLDRYPAGGRVEFAQLPTGHWFVRRWHLRMPVAGERTGARFQRGSGGSRFEPRRQTVLARVNEAGGEAVRVTLPGGETSALARWGAVGGTVRDSVDGSPIAGVEVALAGTAYRGRTDSDGRFSIESVPSGAYALVARHPDAVLLGLPPLDRAISVLEDDVVQAELALPSRQAALANLCPIEAQQAGQDAIHRADPSALYGYVRRAGTGALATGSRVWVARSDYWLRDRPFATMISEEWQVRGVEADSGVYVICGMAGDWHHVVQAESGTAASDTIRLLTRPGEFRRLDFEVVESRALMAGFRRDPREADLDAVVDRLLGLGGGRDSVEEDRGVATLIGTVKAAEDGRPVAGAHVRVLERDEERITGAEGAFVIRDLPRGRYRLVTEHLGMASDTAGVDLRSGAGQMVLFTLETQPIALPTLDVQIERTFRSPRIAEFYERMQRGVGDFIGREDLDARDLVFNMRRLPNVRVDECIDPNSGLRLSGCWHINIARGVSGGALRGDAHCPPVMYVDGRPLPASAGDTRSNAFTLLQNLPRDMLEGIEVYRSPGGAPAQYRTIGDACGIILVWTRGR